MPNQNPFPWVPRRWVNIMFPYVRCGIIWTYSILRALRLPWLTLRDRPDAKGAIACGSCLSVNIGKSIPKVNVREALLTPMGVRGDAQAAPYIVVWGGHGGWDKAVMLWSFDVISTLNAGGAALYPGASGEQLTLGGIDWSLMKTGVRLSIGPEVLLEVTYLKGPCLQLDRFFEKPSDKTKINPAQNPDSSRVLAKVLKPGRVKVGDRVLVFEHPQGKQPLKMITA